MAATATADDEILQVWASFKKIDKESPEYESLRNRLVERYMPLVRYNGERIWQRLPDGVELDDLISAGEGVWWDQDILPGKNWKLAVREALAESYAVVLCFSKEVESRDVSGRR